jgi:hypothetical protein
MEAFLENPVRLVDIVLIFMLLEIVAVVILLRRAQLRVDAIGVVCGITAGGAILLGCRVVLAGQGVELFALCLLLALAAHATDLLRRLLAGRVRTTDGTDRHGHRM